MSNPLTDIKRLIYHYEKVLAKIDAAPQNTQLYMERTFSTACMVLEELDNISVSEVAISVSQLCHEMLSNEFTEKYILQLSLALTNPDAFVPGLHDFYVALSREIRKKKMFHQISDFLGTIMRLQLEKKGTFISENVINAYIDLSMQTLEYLRPNQYAMDTYIMGVNTNGEPLGGPCPYSFSDVPTIQLRRKLAIDGNHTDLGDSWENIQRLYAKCGITVNSPNDFARLEQVQRGFCNEVTALLPFVNEHTFQFAPSRMYDSLYTPLTKITHIPFDLECLQKALAVGWQPLPKKGVCIKFIDPIKELLGLSLMETSYKGKPFVLYKFNFSSGDLSGYYDILDGFLYSVLLEGTSLLPFQNLKALLIAICSSLVLPEGAVQPLNTLFMQNGHPLQIFFFK